jgi:hypothetical protein
VVVVRHLRKHLGRDATNYVKYQWTTVDTLHYHLRAPAFQSIRFGVKDALECRAGLIDIYMDTYSGMMDTYSGMMDT